MTNTYRSISVVGEHYYGEGVNELDLSVMEERDALGSGHLELVPRSYEVLSDNFSGGPRGAKYEATFLREIEQALIDGGHIRRVDDKPVKAVEPPADVPPAEGAPAAKKTK